MAHSLIIGMTESGKSHLGKALAQQILNAGRGVLVLHKPGEVWPLRAPKGVPMFQTPNPDTFIAAMDRAWRCDAFVEFDARENGDRLAPRIDKEDARFHAIAEDSRHNGTQAFFISQRAVQIHPNIRENCARVYLFKTGEKSASLIAEDTAEKAFLDAPNLPPHWFFYRAGAGAAVIRHPPI